MSDEVKKENQDKPESVDNEMVARGEKAITKLEAVRAVKKLSNPNSDWTITQEILQEIIATHKIVNPDKIPTMPKLAEELKREIETRYQEEPELKQLLLDSIPNRPRGLSEWMKKKGWDDAVWEKIRGSQLFSQEKRALMINSLFQRGMDKDTQAAKIWLMLSGDYSEKVELTDKVADKYREINKILHSPKKGE